MRQTYIIVSCRLQREVIKWQPTQHFLTSSIRYEKTMCRDLGLYKEGQAHSPTMDGDANPMATINLSRLDGVFEGLQKFLVVGTDELIKISYRFVDALEQGQESRY